MRRVVLLAFDGATVLDLVGPMEVFDTAGQVVAGALGRSAGYRMQVVSPEGATIHGTNGLRIDADRALGQVRGPVDTLVVVGGTGARSLSHDAKFLRRLTRAANRSRRVASVCTGAFLLAAAGLLEGRRATTHWAYCDELAARFPAVNVQPDAIYVGDGNVFTSAGVTAGMDLALALVETDHGRDVALETARWLVLFVRRPGGQSQFSAQLSSQLAERDALRDLQHHILEHVADDLRVERLAAVAGMSPRNFARVFRRDVGVTPAVYVERVRVEVARRLLETTSLDMLRVAEASGLGTPQKLRRAFTRHLGVSPTHYRTRFAGGGTPWTSSS